MSTIRRMLDEQVAAGRLREQCQRCGCDKKHHNAKERRCDVCWDHCVYRPCWVIVGR